MSEFDEQDQELDEQFDDTEMENEPSEMDDDLPEESENENDPAETELGFSFDEAEKDDTDFKGQPAPEWVKELRKQNREYKRQLKQYEAQYPQQQALRDKPTLAAYDYDADAYEQDLQQWVNEKAHFEQQQQAEQQRYQQYEDKYRSSVDSMRAKVKDYDEIEDTIVDMLSPQKQAILKLYADSPAAMVYALGKSPNKLNELMQMDDIQFSKQITLMEQQMPTAKKTRNPAKPAPKAHDLTGGAGGGDTQLAKLEAEAAKTGDRSKVMAYKKQQRMKK